MGNFHGLVSKCGLCMSIGCLPELGAGTLPHFSFLIRKYSVPLYGEKV